MRRDLVVLLAWSTATVVLAGAFVYMNLYFAAIS